MKIRIVPASEIAENKKQSLAPRDYILDEAEYWDVDEHGTEDGEAPVFLWACGEGACDAKGAVREPWQEPRYCPECGSPIGHCDEHLEDVEVP